jgi:hypothetical protein
MMVRCEVTVAGVVVGSKVVVVNMILPSSLM